MDESIPRLEILPVTNMVVHEWHDDQRTPPLIARFQQSGVCRNPPIVTSLPDGSQRYMVLDGANRITAFRQMGIPHSVVQVVEADNAGLKLYNWNHVLWGWDSSELFSILARLSDINLVSSEGGMPDLVRESGLAMMQTAEGDLYTICTSVEVFERRVAILNAIVDSYKDHAKIDRTNEWSVVRLKAIYPDLCGLMIFPHFKIHQVLSLVAKGCLLPTGITRFMISPRVLHLNYPIDEMAAEKTLEEKNATLQRFIQERIADKGVRYYAEATYLFDE